MYAPGLPDKKIKSSIPRAENATWQLNLQEHDADKAGLHTDLRLSPPGSRKAYSWAVPKGMPGTGQKHLAVRQPDHDSDYMGWSGIIEDGYGKGEVKSKFLGDVDILKAGDSKIEFNMYPGRDTKRFILLRRGGSDEWMLYNYTPSEETKVYEDVPDYKKSYKTIDASRLNLDTSRTEEVFAPKLDGAHNLVVLRPNKRPDVFSYRSSRRGSERIDHTFKTPLYKQTSPKELGDTILRSELFIPGGKGNDTARILNSSVPKARELQQKERPLEFKIFDVVKFKGQNVEDLPYNRKLEMLKEVRDKLPDLKLPELAFDPHDKRRLFNRIMKGAHPETEEGIVVYKLDKSVPRKVKQTDDYDAEIVGTFEASEGSKYQGEGVGGFIALPEGSSVPIRIGTGLSDDLRQRAYENPDEFIGEWAKIKSQHIHESGLHQAPVLVDIRPEKFMNKAASLNYLIEKNAVGPLVQYRALPGGRRGQFVPDAGTKGRIDIDPITSKGGERKILRHELTHYLNKEKGRYPNTSEKSLRGVKDTFLNEMSASRSELRNVQKNNNPLVRAGRAVDHLKASYSSTKSAYGAKTLRDILKVIR